MHRRHFLVAAGALLATQSAGADTADRRKTPEFEEFMRKQTAEIQTLPYKNNVQGMRDDMRPHILGEGSSVVIDELLLDRYSYYANLNNGYQKWDRSDKATVEAIKAAEAGLNSFVSFIANRPITEMTFKPIRSDVPHLIIYGPVANLKADIQQDRHLSRVGIGYEGSAKNVSVDNIVIDEIAFDPYTTSSRFSFKTDGNEKQAIGRVFAHKARVDDVIFKNRDFLRQFDINESHFENPTLYRCKTSGRDPNREGITIYNGSMRNGTFISSDLNFVIGGDKSFIEQSVILGGKVSGTGLESLAQRTGIAIGVEWADPALEGKLDKRFWITSTAELNTRLADMAAQGVMAGPNQEAVATAATYILRDKDLQAELAAKGVDVSPETLATMERNLSRFYERFDYLKGGVDELVAGTVDKPALVQAQVAAVSARP